MTSEATRCAGAERVLVDVAVVGGGPAGIAAALWAARYRRRVLLIDGGEQRNRWTHATHGYLGFEGCPPSELLDRAREDLGTYPEVSVARSCRVTSARVDNDAFELTLDSGRKVHALRLVLATGVRDVFPHIEGFEDHFGSTVFTCPSCDGYEAQGRRVAVIGEDEHLLAFALGLRDWAESIMVVSSSRNIDPAPLAEHGITLVDGDVVAFEGREGRIRSLRLRSGNEVSCDMVFCTIRHEQHSDLAHQLGCEISGEGCVVVDADGRTSCRGVFAAGDMTPGPHLVQIAAAEGAAAGIAAAMSLRGARTVPSSPHPAPDADQVLNSRG
ncbi:MAG: NAD(P)/FAD-dependent oxidoreductase [Ilumatobacteraceae bacterium]|nr:NAD(P)/FAD-dependent oxidoreductase [Ilumatobacteraceae bacterium]